MRSQRKRIGRLPIVESDLKSVVNPSEGDKELNDVVQQISLEKISFEKRREEAEKPLYLVRYE